jgi:hypothetical protein
MLFFVLGTLKRMNEDSKRQLTSDEIFFLFCFNFSTEKNSHNEINFNKSRERLLNCLICSQVLSNDDDDLDF